MIERGATGTCNLVLALSFVPDLSRTHVDAAVNELISSTYGRLSSAVVDPDRKEPATFSESGVSSWTVLLELSEFVVLALQTVRIVIMMTRSTQPMLPPMAILAAVLSTREALAPVACTRGNSVTAY